MRGWKDVRANGAETVVCIACGETLARSDAREYDKYGDGWDREGERFEDPCKPCDRECCHYPRDGLEETLIEANAGGADRGSFLRAFLERCERDPPAGVGE